MVRVVGFRCPGMIFVWRGCQALPEGFPPSRPSYLAVDLVKAGLLPGYFGDVILCDTVALVVVVVVVVDPLV